MGARRKRRKDSAPSGERSSARTPRRRATPLWIWGLPGVGLVGLVLISAALSMRAWATTAQGSVSPKTVHLPAVQSRLDLADNLKAQGLIDKPLLFAGYWALFHPFARVEPGVHTLPAQQSASQLLALLTRRANRPQVKISIPEGWNSFQIAARLAERNVCDEQEIVRLVRDKTLVERAGVAGGSLEGYLYPDTYDLYLNSHAESILLRFVERAKAQHSQLFAEHDARLAELQAEFGFGLHQVVTMASVLEKEAANPAEHAQIASVFFNRLRDPTFRPLKMLQSDPTAGYGCLLTPKLGSCTGYAGRITPQMLRDPQNPYNSYRNPGLPPGPIGNPGLSALQGVLRPADTPYLFFVAKDSGGHAFSRTLAEHEAAIKGGP